MSHNLRVPINAILGIAEVLQEGIYGSLNQRQTKSIRTIEESGIHLLESINSYSVHVKIVLYFSLLQQVKKIIVLVNLHSDC